MLTCCVRACTDQAGMHVSSLILLWHAYGKPHGKIAKRVATTSHDAPTECNLHTHLIANKNKSPIDAPTSVTYIRT